MNINELLEEFKTKDAIPTKLDKKIVEYGEIFKYLILKNSFLEISILQIAPNSKIRKHSHCEDSELYFCITNEKYSICKKGESHGLTNDSDEWMQVVSIKTKYSES